jgi:hypothetical protein
LHTYYNYKRACFDASPALLPHGSETPSTSKQKSPDDNLLINEFEMSEFEDRNEFEMVHETFKRLEKPASTLGSDVIGDFISDFTLSQINGNQSIISQLVGSDFERKGVGSKPIESCLFWQKLPWTLIWYSERSINSQYVIRFWPYHHR